MTSLIHMFRRPEQGLVQNKPSIIVGETSHRRSADAAAGVALLGIIGLGTAALTPSPAIAAENDKSIIIKPVREAKSSVIPSPSRLSPHSTVTIPPN